MSNLDKLLRDQRNLDNFFESIPNLVVGSQPKKGWIRAIRQSLGMTLDQLGNRVHPSPNRKKNAESGINKSSVAVLEKNEVNGSITLDSLRRVAEALDCELVYMLKPKTSLSMTFDSQVNSKLDTVLSATKSTMDLEDQDYGTLQFSKMKFIEESAKKNSIWD